MNYSLVCNINAPDLTVLHAVAPFIVQVFGLVPKPLPAIFCKGLKDGQEQACFAGHLILHFPGCGNGPLLLWTSCLLPGWGQEITILITWAFSVPREKQLTKTFSVHHWACLSYNSSQAAFILFEISVRFKMACSSIKCVHTIKWKIPPS